jgi:hypothetical protein
MTIVALRKMTALPVGVKPAAYLADVVACYTAERSRSLLRLLERCPGLSNFVPACLL